MKILSALCEPQRGCRVNQLLSAAAPRVGTTTAQCTASMEIASNKKQLFNSQIIICSKFKYKNIHGRLKKMQFETVKNLI